MALIPLSNSDRFLTVDDCFQHVFSFYTWHMETTGYARARICRNQVYAHHYLLGPSPSGMVVDHINRDRLDNRLCNLRWVTQRQNTFNSSKTRTGLCKYKGVARKRKRFSAQITHNYRIQYLGTYDTEEEAARVYDEKAKELFGEFASLNFSSEREVG